MTETPLPALPYELFDCLQANIAVLADRWHGTGTHLRLGSTLRFRPVTGADGLPSVERTAEECLADSRRGLGIAVRALHRTPAADRLCPAEGCYVVSDAYHLPWVPYFEQRHMDHSFLAEASDVDGVQVVDGYHNETPWGSARPGQWTVPADVFTAAVPAPALIAELAPAAKGLGPVAAALDLAGPDAVDAYIDAYSQHLDRVAALSRLTLETWLLARSRKLHAAFRAQYGPKLDGDAVDAHLRAWDALTEQAYLASRRVERGRAEPQGLLPRLREQLHADSVVFGGAPSAGESAESHSASEAADTAQSAEIGLRGTVAGVAADVLGTGIEPLLSGQSLSEVPQFSSFRIVEIVERLEEELRFEFDADDLVPENLHDIDAICAVVRQSLNAEPAFAHSQGVR